MAYESYSAYLLGNGVSNQAKNQIHTKLMMNSTFKDSPNYSQVLINSNLIYQDAWIVDDSDVKDQKRIVTMEYQVKNGDIIDWQNAKWINILTDNMADIYYRGMLRRCVGQLKWLDENGDIQQSYFTFKSDPATNFGVTDGRIITLGNERRNLIMQHNEHTAKFTKNTRFIFDGRAWKVTAIDTISVNGLSILTVDEDLMNEIVDNVELGIADYVGRVANYTLKILNNETISLLAGEILQLNVQVLNNGVIVQKPIVFNTSDESIATVDGNGLLSAHVNGSVIISASLATDINIKASINVMVENIVQDNYSAELLEKPTLTINKTKTFNVQVKNNGVIDASNQIDIQLYNQDQSSTVTNIASAVSSFGNQITVKGLNIGFVWLKISIQNTVNQECWIRVDVKSLI